MTTDKLINELLQHVTEYLSDSGFSGDIYRYRWDDEKIVRKLLEDYKNSK